MREEESEELKILKAKFQSTGFDNMSPEERRRYSLLRGQERADRRFSRRAEDFLPVSEAETQRSARNEYFVKFFLVITVIAIFISYISSVYEDNSVPSYEDCVEFARTDKELSYCASIDDYYNREMPLR